MYEKRSDLYNNIKQSEYNYIHKNKGIMPNILIIKSELCNILEAEHRIVFAELKGKRNMLLDGMLVAIDNCIECFEVGCTENETSSNVES